MCPCKRNINATDFLFNTEHSVINLINRYELHGNPSTLTRDRALPDNRQTNRPHKHFLTLFESLKTPFEWDIYIKESNSYNWNTLKLAKYYYV